MVAMGNKDVISGENRRSRAYALSMLELEGIVYWGSSV